MNVRDINAATDADLAVMTSTEIRELYNQIMRQLQVLGCTQYHEGRKVREIKQFHDKPKAIASIRLAESALRAWESGQRHVEAQPEITSGLLTDQDPGTVSPGRARLLASGHAEEIRQAVVEDQEAAAAMAAGEAEPEKGTQKMAKAAKKVKAKKANGKVPREKTERRVRPLKWSDDATITKLVEGNPKRGASQAVFALYRSGMKVGSFIAKAVEMGLTRSEAGGHLRWDSDTERKGGSPLIKIA